MLKSNKQCLNFVCLKKEVNITLWMLNIWFDFVYTMTDFTEKVERVQGVL